MQDPIEQVGGSDGGAAQIGLDVQQLQDVARDDVGNDAALGDEDLGSAICGAGRRGRVNARIRSAAFPQPGEAGRVTVLGEHADERAAAKRRGDQPGQ
ncbi:hypothetical protein [Streptomyces sp. NRRL S-813]|uniref:hypothetical protein n=1 Tax=Streptomyces sp. NRRL S-813 TaxID=1463919 RepID=UPI0019020C35|nr:hypothetical protein [Streptomyces sp. NRRL S-813]